MQRITLELGVLGFSKIDSSNMSAFPSVLDVCADIMNIRKGIFGLPAPFSDLVFLLRHKHTFSSKTIPELTTNLLVGQFTMCSCASTYPINGI
jgi:hypothetical protein